MELAFMLPPDLFLVDYLLIVETTVIHFAATLATDLVASEGPGARGLRSGRYQSKVKAMSRGRTAFLSKLVKPENLHQAIVTGPHTSSSEEKMYRSG